MPTVRRSRKLEAPPEDVWEVVRDPHHMPRWWPDVQRMEGVEDDRFTQVFMTKRGRAVRADHQLLESAPPSAVEEAPGRVCWTQEIEGTPFERVLNEAITEVVLEPAGAGTMVTIAQSHRLRGYSRTGTFLLRRATRRRLDQAL